MLNKNIFFGLIILSITFFSCSPQYGVANQSSLTKYLEKPIYKDSAESAIYVAGQYFNNSGEGYQQDERSYFVDFSVHRSHTHKNFNYSYGVLGYFGNYESDFEGYEGKKDFYGLGALADINYKISLDKLELRIIGLRASIIHEMGEFSDYREELSDLGLAYNHNIDNTPIYLGFNTDVVYKWNSDFNLGLYMGLGRTFDKGESSTGSVIYTSILHANYKRFTGLAQLNLALGGNFAVYSFGLQYQLF